MNPATTAVKSHLPMDINSGRSSSVILQRVPLNRVNDFLQWEREITTAAEQFPGYHATDLYPPADPDQQDWVVVIHFDDAASLKKWLDSPVRAEWIRKQPSGIGGARVKVLADGFGTWFASLVNNGPAGWQMALTVVLGLYPTVMLLGLAVGRFLSPLGLAVSMLIGNALSVSILQWGVMPLLERALRPWLHPDGENPRAVLVGGAILILALLAGMVILFRLVTG